MRETIRLTICGPKPMIAGSSHATRAQSQLSWVGTPLESHRIWAENCDDLGSGAR
jgi:hypothetical protein